MFRQLYFKKIFLKAGVCKITNSLVLNRWKRRRACLWREAVRNCGPSAVRNCVIMLVSFGAVRWRRRWSKAKH